MNSDTQKQAPTEEGDVAFAMVLSQFLGKVGRITIRPIFLNRARACEELLQ